MEEVVDVKVLGPTEVRHDGSPLALRGAKPRQLLVLLAIRANSPVPTEQLIEELWEGDPPPSAATALRVHFGRLRGVLEPHRSPSTPSARLPAGPHGYLLRLEPDELDTERFERKVQAARRANADGDPARAVPQLTEALDLWRGPALVDVRDLSAGRSEIVRLDELHAVAFEELADARLALGEHTLVIDVLAAAIDEFPLRETLTARLMVALYRSARAPDALRAYAALATRLDESGTVPSEALRRLEEDVLLQRVSLDFVARAEVGLVHLHLPTVRMIGRRQEFRDLFSETCAAPSEQVPLNLVAGPAGIGKSVLVRALGDRVEREGRLVVVGMCELHPSEPYAPLGTILRTLRRLSGAADVYGTDPLDMAFFDPGSAALGTRQDDVDRRTAQFRLFETLADVLARGGAGAVVVIEDLHWAERPTLLLLRHLIRHPSLTGVSFVATYRDDDISGERLEMIQTLAPPSQCRIHCLRPFHDGEVRSLVHAIAPPEMAGLLADHASTLCDITGGNPFFLRELLREVDDELLKHATDDDVLEALSQLAPAGVRALIHRRVERLTQSSRSVLEVAAVLNEGITTGLLADVCDTAPEAVMDAVEECLAVRLLVEDLDDFERFMFPHSLVRNAVYVGVPEAQRMEIHRRIAVAMSQESGASVRIATLARHFCEAAPLGLHREAAAYAEQAGVDAERHLMFSQAVTWYERAVELQKSTERDDRAWGQLQLALGRAYGLDKHTSRAQEAFVAAAEAARRIGDPALLADVALAADGPWSAGSDYQAATLPLLEEALGRLDDTDDGRRVRLLAGIASDLYYVDAEREGYVARQAVEIAANLDDREAKAAAQVALHRWSTHDPSARSTRLALSRSACDEVLRTGPPGELSLLLQRSLLSDLLENAEIVEFHDVLTRYEEQASVVGSPRDIYWAMALRATEATLHGNLSTADQMARGAALRGHELEQLSDGALILQRFVIRYQQARLAEELPLLRKIHRPDSVFRAGAALAATALSEAESHDSATEIVWKTLGDDGSGLRRDVFWIGAVALFSGVAARSADHQLQRLLHQLLLPCRDHVVVFGSGGAVLGSAHYWLGLLSAALGDIDAAYFQFHQAITVADLMDAPFWRAEAELASARLLSNPGPNERSKRAAQFAASARATAQRLGFGRIVGELPEIL